MTYVVVEARMSERFRDVPEEVNDLGRLVVGVGIGVLRDYGPGMLERPYQLALAQRLANLRHHVRLDQTMAVAIEGGPLTKAYNADIIVDDTIVVEVKSMRGIELRHIMQTKTYLRVGSYPLGYVLNFGTPLLGIKRVVP